MRIHGDGQMTAVNAMEVDSVHLLEDLARFYHSGTDMVVSEAFGNAVDVDATELQIELGEDQDGKYILFVNNGPPMSENDFRNYHVIARSSKTFGKGLGWAGIGAKLYLGSWLKSKIITESSDGHNSLASVMFIEGNQVYWNFVTPRRKLIGTSYKVYLNSEDYDVLSKNITQIVLKYFNTAMKNGLNVTIQGKKLDFWKPAYIKTFHEEIKIKGKKLPITLWTTNEDIPEERCNIEFHVSGKCIAIRKPRNLLSNVKPEFKRKFYVIVDALCISDQLETHKHNFKAGLFYSDVEPAIVKKLYQILKPLGYLEDPEEAKSLRNKFTKSLQKILKEHFPELNPESICGDMNRGGNSPGKGKKPDKEGQKSKEKTNENKDKQNNPKRPRNRGGFSFTTVIKPEDNRQGWMQIESNQIVVNLGHSVARSMEKTRESKQYHLCRIICSELLKLAAKAGKITVESAFEVQDKIFALIDEYSHKNGQNIWNFSTEQNIRRDSVGRFLPRE